MASYIIDVLCGEKKFPNMNWAWKKGCPPIHDYYLELCDTKYKYSFEKVCNNFVSPLLPVLTYYPTHYMLECARELVLETGDWYVS